MRDRIPFSEDDGKMYDVVAVSTENNKVLWVDGPKTLPNAEAVVRMAIMRQGLSDRFFAEAPAGKFKQGDKYSNGN